MTKNKKVNKKITYYIIKKSINDLETFIIKNLTENKLKRIERLNREYDEDMLKLAQEELEETKDEERKEDLKRQIKNLKDKLGLKDKDNDK